MINFDKFKKVGTFKLTSGEESSYYYDIKEAMGDPIILNQIIKDFAEKFDFKNIDLIVGIAYGGVPVAIGLSLITGVPYAILRSSFKTHGTKKRLEGFQPETRCRILVLDDVSTTGETMHEAKNYLKSLNHRIVATDVVFDRKMNND